MESDIVALKLWLKHNDMITLAKKFGYTSTQAIRHWIARGRLPRQRRKDILKFINRSVMND